MKFFDSESGNVINYNNKQYVICRDRQFNVMFFVRGLPSNMEKWILLEINNEVSSSLIATGFKEYYFEPNTGFDKIYEEVLLNLGETTEEN